MNQSKLVREIINKLIILSDLTISTSIAPASNDGTMKININLNTPVNAPP